MGYQLDHQLDHALQSAKAKLLQTTSGKIVRIGRSVCGRPIEAWSWGKGHWTVHLQAAMHANEWITTLAFATWLERMIDSDMDLPYRLVAVPLVNPDGVSLVLQHGRLDWKANVNGIDLNDQFPAGWAQERERRMVGKSSEPGPRDYGGERPLSEPGPRDYGGERPLSEPGPRDYGGERPLSEPEARALVRLTNGVRPDVVIALHTQGREIYYNYRGYEPAFAGEWATYLGNAVSKRPYKAVALSDSDAGFKDWFIQHTGKPGFTIEMGSGTNPLPIDQVEELIDDLDRMMQALGTLLQARKDIPPSK
jgi:g-D-glutamyl-meso-diaminopimelate peptidase